MTYPILKPKDTWFTNNAGIEKASITEVFINAPQPVSIKAQWDAGVKNGEITCYVTNDNKLYLSSNAEKIALNENSSSLFDAFSNVIYYNGLEYIDATSCRDLSRAFCKNLKLKILDLNTWNVSNVTNLAFVFAQCIELLTLNISNWNVGKVTDMTQGFFLLSKLKSMDLSSWDVSQCRKFDYAFMGYTNRVSQLESLGDISNWDVRNAISIQSMFSYTNMKKIDIRNWNLEKCTNAKYVCQECPELLEIDASNVKFGTSCSVRMFACHCPKLHTFSCNNLKANECYGVFGDCPSLVNIDVSNWDISQCTSLAFMFWGCSKLQTLNFANWDVSKVTTTDHFLAHDIALENYDVSKWNTASLINANGTFHSTKPAVLDVSNWDTSKVQHFAQMFEGVGANRGGGTKVLGLEKFNTAQALSFNEMFHGAWINNGLDLSSFDTRKAKNDVVQSENGMISANMKDMFLDANTPKITISTNFAYNGDGTNTLEANKAVFPTGTWYTVNGTEYTSQDAPKQAGTYYKDKATVENLSAVVKNKDLIAIGNAIREKNGLNEKYLVSEMAEQIRSLPNAIKVTK